MPAPYTSSMDGYGHRAAEQQRDRRVAAVVDVKLLDGAVEKVGGGSGERGVDGRAHSEGIPEGGGTEPRSMAWCSAAVKQQSGDKGGVQLAGTSAEEELARRGGIGRRRRDGDLVRRRRREEARARRSTRGSGADGGGRGRRPGGEGGRRGGAGGVGELGLRAGSRRPWHGRRTAASRGRRRRRRGGGEQGGRPGDGAGAEHGGREPGEQSTAAPPVCCVRACVWSA